jgi:hypothetical protein
MLNTISEQKFFEQFMSLVGREISLITRSSGEKIEGTVENSMFDSFVLLSKTGKRIIRFDDLLFFESLTD